MSRILVVDDVFEARHLLRTVLTHAGHEVVEAVNGAEALQTIRDGSIDLVVSDGLMPVMDGFRLCIELRRDAATSTLPFILYTATFTDPDDARLASTMGADAYLLKPSDPTHILQVVNDLLARRVSGPEGVLSDDRLVEALESYSHRLEQKFDKKISDLDEARSLRDSYQALLDNLPVHIVTLDLEGRPDFANAMVRAFTGTTDPAALLDAVSSNDRAAMTGFIESLQKDPRPMKLSATIERHDGAHCVFEVTARPYESLDGTPLGFVLAGEDITLFEQQRELLLRASERDPLTDLPTRHVFDQRFDAILRNVGKGARCALLFIDSDDFRGINDRFGFDVGDATIANLARTIAESVRPGDLVARLCATEFVVLAEDLDWEEAGELSSVIRSAVTRASLVPAAPDMSINVNININVVPDAPPSATGGTQAAHAAAPVNAENRLLEALRGQPTMAFRPVYSLSSHQLVRCSMRYAYAVDERLISGDELALGAAKHGVARYISTRIIELALEHIQASGVSCSVPLSLANILDPMIFERAELAAAQLAVDPTRLLFEIPDCDADGIRPPASWLAAAQSSAIGLVHVCSDISALRIDIAGIPRNGELVLPVTEILDKDGRARPSASSLIEAWRDANFIVTVSDVTDLGVLEELMLLGVTQAAGDALSPITGGLAQIPRTFPGKG